MSPAPRPPALLEVLRMSTGYLADHGSGSARLDAELLTAHALGLRRLDLYLQHDRPLREDELAPVRALLRRRGEGEPVAYLTGSREFYGRSLEVTPAVLIPRPDTETLIEVVLGWARLQHRPLRIADLGTGSGCIALTLAAELADAEVVATDVSAGAVAVARRNAERLGVADRTSVLEGSWTEPLAGGDRFDIVVSNPPYVTTSELHALDRDVRDFEPTVALLAGADGLDAYRGVLGGVAGLLAPRWLLALEVDPRRAAAVAGLLAAAVPGGEVETRADLTGRPRVVLAKSPG